MREILDRDLINKNLRNIYDRIQSILEKWGEVDPSQFIKKARKGSYPESENDIIDLRQLLIDEKKL